MLHGLSGSGTNCMDGFSSLKSISGLRMVFPSAPSVRTRCAPQLTPKHFDPNFKLSPPKNPLRHLHRLSPSPPELRFEHRAQRGTPTPPLQHPLVAQVSFGGFPLTSWLPPPGGAGGLDAMMGSMLAMLKASAPEVKASVDYVWDLIRREIARGVPPDKIVVGGFSQGGLIATRAALGFPDATIGGALALSTFFGGDAASVAEANREIKFFVAHGAEDPLVPPKEGERVAERLRALAPKASVSFNMYAGMKHEYGVEEMRGVMGFLQGIMGVSADTADASPSGVQGGTQTPAAASATASARASGHKCKGKSNCGSQSDAPEEKKAEKQELEPPLSEAQLAELTAGKLKAYLKGRGVRTDDCFEKSELFARAVEQLQVLWDTTCDA